MSGFNFGKIGNVISKYMDTDYIDIKRESENVLREIYSNISCHVAYSSVDNPDPTTVDVKPVIQSLTVHLPNWVDIQNNDFIVAKKMSGNGELLAVYSGRCGNPVVSQGRKKILIAMNASGGQEVPTPVPPINPCIIVVNYLSSDKKQISPSISFEKETGETVEISASKIEGYKFENSYVDGVEKGNETIIIPNIDSDIKIVFIYSESEEFEYYRILTNGYYTKNTGELAVGLHFYKKVEIENIEEMSSESWKVTSKIPNFVHEDSGKRLNLEVGTVILLMPGNVFAIVMQIISQSDGKIIFETSQFEPSEEEKNAYITDRYD